MKTYYYIETDPFSKNYLTIKPLECEEFTEEINCWSDYNKVVEMLNNAIHNKVKELEQQIKEINDKRIFIEKTLYKVNQDEIEEVIGYFEWKDGYNYRCVYHYPDSDKKQVSYSIMSIPIFETRPEAVDFIVKGCEEVIEDYQERVNKLQMIIDKYRGEK